MSTRQDIHNLLGDLFSDFDRIAIVSQLGIIAVCLVLAWVFTRLARRRVQKPLPSESALRFGLGSINRVLFPLTALLMVLVVKTIAQRHGYHVALLAIAVPLLGSLALIRLAVYILRHIFAPGDALKSLERSFAIFIWGLVALHITGFLPEIVQAMEELELRVGKVRISLFTIVTGFISVAVTLLVALWLSSTLEKRLMAAENFSLSLRVVFAKLLRALLVVAGVLIALPLAGIDITVLSVFGGALGVGVGFGLQKIASNYISGFIILLDRSIRIGDLVTIDNRYGTVSNITSRYVVVKGTDGTEAIIPNETLITSTVLNHSYTNRQLRISIPLQVAYDKQLERASALMLEAAAAHPRVLQEPAPKVFLKSFADSGIELELDVWIEDPEQAQLDLRSDLNWAIWRAFQREGIEIPYPQRVVTLRNSG